MGEGKKLQKFAMEQVQARAPKTIWQKVETVFVLSIERIKNTVQKKKKISFKRTNFSHFF
jgi:hypothetical protein